MADRRRIFTVQDAINAGITPRSVTTPRQQSAISGIGQMRSIGSPQDPRREQGERRYTLPALLVPRENKDYVPRIGDEPGPTPRYGSPRPERPMGASPFQLNALVTPAGYSPAATNNAQLGTNFAQIARPPRVKWRENSEFARLQRKQDEKNASQNRSQAPTRGLRALLSGDAKEVNVFDPNFNAKQKVTAEEIPQLNSSAPALPLIYKDFVKGLTRNERDVKTPSEIRNYNEEEGIGRSVKGDRKMPAAFGLVDLVQVTPDNKIQDSDGNLFLRGIDPTQEIEAPDGRPMNLGQYLNEVRLENSTPVMGRTALIDAYRGGRFTPVPKEERDRNHIGNLRQKKIDKSTGIAKVVEVEVPVYQILDYSGTPVTTTRHIPKGDGSSKEYEEELFRVGHPLAHDVDRMREAAAAVMPGMESILIPRKKGEGFARTRVDLAALQQAIRDGRITSTTAAPDENLAQLEMLLGNGLDAAAKPLVQRHIDQNRKAAHRADRDGSQTRLFSVGNDQYQVEDAFVRTDSGPAYFSNNELVRKAAEREYQKVLEDEAESVGENPDNVRADFMDIWNQLEAGKFMDTPRQAPGIYRDIVDMIVEGRFDQSAGAVTLDNLVTADGRKMFPPGSYKRAVIEQEIKTRRNQGREQRLSSPGQELSYIDPDRLMEKREARGWADALRVGREGWRNSDDPYLKSNAQEDAGGVAPQNYDDFLADLGEEPIVDAAGDNPEQVRAAMVDGYSVRNNDTQQEVPDYIKKTPEWRAKELLKTKVKQHLLSGFDRDLSQRVQQDIDAQADDIAMRAIRGDNSTQALGKSVRDQMGGPVRTVIDPYARGFGTQPTEPVNIRTLQQVLDTEAQQGMADARPQTAVVNTTNVSQLNAPAPPTPGEVPGAPDPRPLAEAMPDRARNDVESAWEGSGYAIAEDDYPADFGQDDAEALLGSYLRQLQGR